MQWVHVRRGFAGVRAKEEKQCKEGECCEQGTADLGEISLGEGLPERDGKAFRTT